MKRTARRTILGAITAATLMGGMALPATATDGHVYAHRDTPGHTKAGASAYADLNFTGQRHIVYNNFVVNDTCPGDGYRALGRAIVKYRDGRIGHGSWHIDSGCSGDGWGPKDGLDYSGTGDIMSAGVQACVDLGDKNVCASDWRDNPYTHY